MSATEEVTAQATTVLSQNESNSVNITEATSPKEEKPKQQNNESRLVDEIKSITLNAFGNSKHFKVIKGSRPTPMENEVLVNVKACGMNFMDLLVRQGSFENLPKPPLVPGFECSGIIVQLGPNTTGYQVGDKVICLPKLGAWSDYININTNYIFKMPDKMTFKDAAAISYNYLTAYILLFELGGIKNGQSVLFHSAGGGVGIALAQLTKLMSNLTVIATCSKSKFDALRHHTSHLFDVNDTSTDYVEETKKICPEGVDLVLDCLSGEHTNKGISLTKPLGKYILYGTSKNMEGETKNYFTLAKNWWHVDKISPLKLYDENQTICGFNLYNYLFGKNQSNARKYLLDIYAKLFALYRDGKIKPVIDSIYSFDNVAIGLAQLQERKNIGKVILDPYYEHNNGKIEKERHSSGGDTSGPDEQSDTPINDELL